MFYETTKTGRSALEVLEETMNLEVLHDSDRAKKALRNVERKRARVSAVQSVQGVEVKKIDGASSP